MTRSNLCDYNDACIYVKRAILVANTGTAAAPNNRNNNIYKVIFTNCVSFTVCISEANYTKVDDAHDVGLMPIYNLLEYSNTYSKKSECLWLYYRNELALGDNGILMIFLMIKIIIVLHSNLNKN